MWWTQRIQYKQYICTDESYGHNIIGGAIATLRRENSLGKKDMVETSQGI